MRSRSRSLPVAAALLASCALVSRRADPSRFFVLTPLTHADGPGSGPPTGLALGVGPVTLPRYLDRPELVTRVDTNEVRPAAFEYWAGSLGTQFERTLADDLALLLGPARVEVHPWYAVVPLDVVVDVDVRQFERCADDQVRLVARWRVRNGRDGGVLRSDEAAFAAPAPVHDAEAGAAALSGTLGDLSRAIAVAVRSARAGP